MPVGIAHSYFVQGSTLYHLAAKSDIMEHMWDFISCATNAGVSFSPATHSLALITAHILTTFILLIIQVCWVPHSSASQLLSTLPHPAWGPRQLVLMESIFRLFCFLASHGIWLVEVPSSRGIAGEEVSCLLPDSLPAGQHIDCVCFTPPKVTTPSRQPLWNPQLLPSPCLLPIEEGGSFSLTLVLQHLPVPCWCSSPIHTFANTSLMCLLSR